MGSGKSSVGKLYQKINYKYGDTDEIIENLEDMSIKKDISYSGKISFGFGDRLIVIYKRFLKTVLQQGCIFERNRDY